MYGRRFLLLLLVAVCAGCNATMTDKIHGTTWTDDEMSRLDGWWMTSDSDILRVKSVGNGEAILAVLDWESAEEGFAVFNVKHVFTHFGEYDFVFQRGRGFNTGHPGYCFARVVSCNRESIQIAETIDKSFLTSVSNKDIDGDVRRDRHAGEWAYITASSDDLLTVLNGRGIKAFFDSSEISTYTKIASPHQKKLRRDTG